ncbi:transposase [Riemerella anatipestifer]|uniref:transposase n=1 Tax=Riemerella anatipestifer TaxID=34085 RepID=UPI0030BEC749
MHSSFLGTITEDNCEKALKSIHLEKGIFCKKCGNSDHYWKADKKVFECKKCRRRRSLTAYTLMHNSKLPIHYWVITLDIILFNQCTVKEIQSLFKKRYQTIYNMHLTISTQLNRLPSDESGVVLIKDLSIGNKILFFKLHYLDIPIPSQQYDWEIMTLYLEWLSQPLIKLD